MRTLFRALALILALALPASLSAQTALSETTTAAAVTASATTVQVASATGAVAGGGLYVDREYMRIASSYVSGTTIPVLRVGKAVPHASGVPVYLAPAVAFITEDRDGSCVAASERYLPQVNVRNGAIWDCNSAVEKWVNLRALEIVTCKAGPLAADSIDQSCFTANRPYLVYRINYVAKTAEAAGTLTLRPTRQQGTEAPASGDLLTAAAINAVTSGVAAETVNTPALTATEANLILATGDRLGLDFTDDVAGELAGVIVTFYLYPL